MLGERKVHEDKGTSVSLFPSQGLDQGLYFMNEWVCIQNKRKGCILWLHKQLIRTQVAWVLRQPGLSLTQIFLLSSTHTGCLLLEILHAPEYIHCLQHHLPVSAFCSIAASDVPNSFMETWVSFCALSSLTLLPPNRFPHAFYPGQWFSDYKTCPKNWS